MYVQLSLGYRVRKYIFTKSGALYIHRNVEPGSRLHPCSCSVCTEETIYMHQNAESGCRLYMYTKNLYTDVLEPRLYVQLSPGYKVRKYIFMISGVLYIHRNVESGSRLCPCTNKLHHPKTFQSLTVKTVRFRQTLQQYCVFFRICYWCHNAYISISLKNAMPRPMAK